MYDFDADGLKEVVIDSAVYDDVNHSLSPLTGYSSHAINEGISPLYFDLNNDGRTDYIDLTMAMGLSNGKRSYFGDIYYQLPDGSYRTETMWVMTWDDYKGQMTSEELATLNDPSTYSLGNVTHFCSSLNFSGASLARAPQRGAHKSVGLGYVTSAPTKAVDLNNDGLTDLIDEKNGAIYTNMGNGKWVITATNGIVISADLNNDGIMDFIFPGATLYTMMWNTTTNQFDVSTLYQNAAVDDLVWCYDFDHDGDLDLLATFSAANNSTGFAYSCFFINDGNGHFTQQDEQDYGTNKLWFSNLQDVDGDGYYDLLAFRGGEVYQNTNYVDMPKTFTTIPDIVWMKGQSNLTFAQPQQLFTTYETVVSYSFNVPIGVVEAEDLNNDGKIDIWVSGMGDRDGYIKKDTICQLPTAAVNAAPTAPSAPTLTLNNGYLTITWGNGSDDHTQVKDLTYDVRVGTSSGAMDVLRPHANADGSRRNFLDGALGRKHSYTIDVRSYSASNLYVAVQAIDAQHVGSAWSAEATIAHNVETAAFTVDKKSIKFAESLMATYTSLPAGYTHTWSAGDATITTISDSKVSITWPTAGNKTITHTVTSSSGTTTSATETVSIFPIAIDTLVEISTIPYPMADYNYDGLMDGVVVSSYRSGAFYAMTVYTGNDEGFSQAAGLWNTNILTSGAYVKTEAIATYMPDMQWRDWNKDGHVDLVFRENIGNYNYTYAYLPHTSGTTLSRRVDDPNIAELFNYTNEQGRCYDIYVLDVDNNGYLDTLYNRVAWKDNYNHYAAYAVLMDENGVMAQDWLFPMEDKDNLRSIKYKGVHFFNGKVYLKLDNGKICSFITQSDERPAAPTGVTATQTDDGLLISWNAAVDDHTPAASMRYNLSVKRSGMTGAGSYIISPQNNENDNAAYIPGYEYISGTQYLIPMSELYSGALEVRLQALDLQNNLSVFTDIVTVTILRDPIEVPSLVCGGEEVTISFQGDESAATPIWDFDGATVVSGSGYGPYSVIWYNGGEKTIRLTIDGQTYSRTLTVDDPGNLPIHMPGEMVKDVDYTISIPEGVTFNGFWVEYNGALRPIDNTGIVTNYGDQAASGMSLPVAYNKCMSANGTTVRINSAYSFILSDPFYLYINVTTENGCSGYLYSSVTIVESATPVLTLVTTDANGHNVVSWMNTSSFPTVRIYKEGNTLNQFALIGEVYGSFNSYTDMNSNSEQKAERYRISVVTTNGSETAMSDIHKTVHLTINRGVIDGTFNLIWNKYEGADVQSYTILRGSTPNTLEVIATMAASNTSYTDQAPVESKPYYAIEYTLPATSYVSQASDSRRAPTAALVGRSNVVKRTDLTDLEDIPSANNNAKKLLIDGHIYILRDGLLYNVSGVRVE